MKINLAKLTTNNLATLAERVINSSKSNKYTVVEGNELLAAVEVQFAVYDKLYTKKGYSGKGAEVAAADQLRDDLFTAIKAFVKGAAGITSLPNYQAATDVLGVIDSYGTSIINMSYSTETAKMRKIIADLDTEDMQANLTALNLDIIYKQLKQAQADFEALYAEQAEANADLRSLPSATAARKGLEKALRAYLDLLTIMSTVPSWQMIYQDISEIVKGSANSTRPTTPSNNPNYKPMNPPRETT